MTASNPALVERYESTLALLERYAVKYRRKPDSISLIAVGKRHSADNIADLINRGHRDFAENYLQEGAEKIERIESQTGRDDGVVGAPVWHFIGHIQSRKCRAIAELFDWVHTVDSLKVANKLNQHRRGKTPLNVHIQLNLQREQNKSGIDAADLPRLAAEIKLLSNLNLRGLMIIPAAERAFDRQRSVFRECRRHLENLNAKGYNLDHLSMGMTADMEAAIAEGATQIRIGTAIFGQRPG